jgi:hypothetical protein
MRSLGFRLRLVRRLATTAAIAALTIAAASTASEAQFQLKRGYGSGPGSPMTGPSPSHGGRGGMPGMDGGGRREPGRPGPRPGLRGIGIGIGVGTIIGTLGTAAAEPPPPPTIDRPPPRRRPATAAPARIHIPPSAERRFVPDEVVLEFAGNRSPQAIEPLLARHRLQLIESQAFALTNATVVRARITNRRPVRNALRDLRNEASIRFGQANFLYLAVQQQPGVPASTEAPPPSAAPAVTFAPSEPTTPPVTPVVATAAARPAAGDPAQYSLAKLRVNEAHNLATGDKVLVAVIDSGVDADHPDLVGAIASSFDALGKAEDAHSHGTAIAGAIAARARLMGVAPKARILAIRAFGKADTSAEATTFAILKGIQHAVDQGARVINMSFAGPADPALARHLSAAYAKGAVLVAAAGNFGPKSPPQYPAADPHVIAVSATDADDKLFKASNVGPHIALAAPGVGILLPAPKADYQLTSGTSFAAAHVSGIAALVLERKPDLSPEAVREILLASARDLGPRGKDPQFGAGLVDAYQALVAVEAQAKPAREPKARSAAGR